MNINILIEGTILCVFSWTEAHSAANWHQYTNRPHAKWSSNLPPLFSPPSYQSTVYPSVCVMQTGVPYLCKQELTETFLAVTKVSVKGWDTQTSDWYLKYFCIVITCSWTQKHLCCIYGNEKIISTSYVNSVWQFTCSRSVTGHIGAIFIRKSAIATNIQLSGSP